MKLLLDTHTILWWVNEHEKLSQNAKAMLLSEEHTLYASLVSLWEMAIKVSLGKLHGLDDGVRTLRLKLDAMPVQTLPITVHHIEAVESLPYIHRDPFDRLLIASAQVEGMTILTADENIGKYGVPTAW